jgi:hypothetical protein
MKPKWREQMLLPSRGNGGVRKKKKTDGRGAFSSHRTPFITENMIELSETVAARADK